MSPTGLMAGPAPRDVDSGALFGPISSGILRRAHVARARLGAGGHAARREGRPRADARSGLCSARISPVRAGPVSGGLVKAVTGSLLACIRGLWRPTRSRTGRSSHTAGHGAGGRRRLRCSPTFARWPGQTSISLSGGSAATSPSDPVPDFVYEPVQQLHLVPATYRKIARSPEGS